MRVTSLKLIDFRAFRESLTLDLATINVLVGANNAGKTTVLKAPSLLQEGLPASPHDVRLPHLFGQIHVGLTDVRGISDWNAMGDVGSGSLVIELHITPRRDTINTRRTLRFAQGSQDVPAFPGAAPRHFIVPFFTKRKTVGYSEDVR